MEVKRVTFLFYSIVAFILEIFKGPFFSYKRQKLNVHIM